MNIVLWIVQGLVAFLYFTGGAYKIFNPGQLVTQVDAIPEAGWRVLGVIEVVGAVLLVVPAATKWMPQLTPLAAVVLTLETLGLALLYSRYSLAIAVSNPMTWALVMGLLVAFVAYGRYSLSPTV